MKCKYWGVIQKNDVKSKNWKLSSDDELHFELLKASQILDPIYLLLEIFKKKSIPNFFIIRYLNDYSSVWKSLLRLFSEFATLVLCKLLNISVYWICHNVDNESITNFPLITKWRRFLVRKACKTIFVTNKLLVKSAQKIFPDKDIRSISFGLVQKNSNFDKELESLIGLKLSESNSTIRILITGSPVPKSKHFDYIERLILKCRELNIGISVLVGGEFEKNIRSLNLLSIYAQYPEILVYDRYINISDDFVRDNFNFYFRVYSDLSVPYTLYESCSLKIPMLTIDGFFLAELIKHSNIGFVLKKDFSNIDIILQEAISDCYYQKFLRDNNWGSLSKELLLSLKQDD
ncbi:hypothetical protein VSVS12_00382 [Vibrio scophthalmi]|uniref:glycosyltransferase n=1 Tax=Vibrio scophthalmi TaxID=45658 RepID=UPI0008093411|nr:glycosyltransferase [Vibrio scophthalmi]ANS84199.1 hypothetical protein VSVS12_00382 [Vibrio scophthalmi]